MMKPVYKEREGRGGSTSIPHLPFNKTKCVGSHQNLKNQANMGIHTTLTKDQVLNPKIENNKIYRLDPRVES